jgi:hypothetical protein
MKKQLFILLLAISPVYLQGITITHGPYLCDMTTDGVTVVWTTDLQGPAWVETENTVTKEIGKDKKDISFLVLNDIHSRAGFMKELCSAVDFKTLDFVCFNGDMWEWLLDENMLFNGCVDIKGLNPSANHLFNLPLPH